jgi:hypothetical protein
VRGDVDVDIGLALTRFTTSRTSDTCSFGVRCTTMAHMTLTVVGVSIGSVHFAKMSKELAYCATFFVMLTIFVF